MKKCAIYARVSTDEQGTSIINQQEYFKNYIKRYNYEIYDIYSDEAFSGTETTKRLSFQRLLDDGKNKRYDVLLAKSYSRFGRNQRETLTALSELFESGIRIIFVEDGLDSERDKGQFGLFAWLAEQEARKISERIKITWQYYNKKGKIHTTFAPFGYIYDKELKNFVVNEEQAEVVKLIYSMYIKGNGIRKIANYLIKNGYKSQKDAVWSYGVVRCILTNEVYIGTLIQGKYKVVDVTIKKLQKIDEKYWIKHKNHHKAIISENDFYIVQKSFKKRSDYSIDNRKSRHSNIHLFSNLLKCKICGSSFSLKNQNNKNRPSAYSCIEYEYRGVEICGHKRNAVSEKVLIKYLRAELELISKNNYEVIKNYYEKKNNAAKNSKEKISLKKINKQIEEKTNLSLSLLNAYSKGIVGDTQYKLQNESIEKDLKYLTEQREILISEQNKYKVKADGEKEMINTIKNLLNLDVEQWTNEMMKKIIDKIEVNMRENEVDFYFKFNVPI